MKARYLGRGIGLASVVLLIALVGSASAKDQWFVLGEKAVKSMRARELFAVGEQAALVQIPKIRQLLDRLDPALFKLTR